MATVFKRSKQVIFLLPSPHSVYTKRNTQDPRVSATELRSCSALG
ncbi:hypothetical protein HNQ95_003038 [Aminobacter ciceronei]|jgi:hypothetical protein|nr:hypothetical protein [Aminobacter ciceronei]MBA9020965.1 hypothetical protein [Aminobacter ciceronei]